MRPRARFGIAAAWLVWLGGLGFVAEARAGAAVALPTASEVLNWDGFNVASGPGSFSDSSTTAALYGIDSYLNHYVGGYAVATISANGQRVSAADTITLDYPAGGGGYDIVAATVQYYFEIAGPTSTVLVDVSAAGEANLNGSSGFYNDAIFYLTDDAGNVVARGNDQGLGAFSFTVPETLSTGEIYGVFIQASAINGSHGLGSSSWVDPGFAIDPSVTDQGAYTFTYSEGVSPSAVPEPPVSVMIAFGLALLGVLRRARRLAALSITTAAQLSLHCDTMA